MFTPYFPKNIAIAFLTQAAHIHGLSRKTGYLAPQGERFFNGCALELSAWHLGLSEGTKAVQKAHREK